MKFNVLKVFTLMALIIFGFSLSASAQKKRAISAKDKAEIKKIFSKVDPSKYRLEFKGETLGKKPRLKMEDLKRLSATRNSQAAGVKWTFVAGDRSENEVIYVYTEGMSELVSLIGKQKASQLKAILAKY